MDSSKEEKFKQHRSDSSNFKGDLHLNECFICKEAPIKSHSIPEEHVLNKLTGEIGKGQQKVYGLENALSADFHELKIDYFHSEFKLPTLGKQEASVFKGFCKVHDAIFAPVENGTLFNGSYEHNFLHSFRAYAYSIHRQIGMLTNFQSENKLKKSIANVQKDINSNEFQNTLSMLENIEVPKFNNPINATFKKIIKEHLGDYKNEQVRINNDVNATIDDLIAKSNSIGDLTEFIKINKEVFSTPFNDIVSKLETLGSKVNLSPILNIKDSLIKALNSGNYEFLDYRTFYIDRYIPLTCALAFSVSNVPVEFSLCVIPDFKENKTVIIFSTIDNTKKKREFFDKLVTLNDSEIQNLVSTIIIKETSNTYLSPSFFDSYSDEKKQKIFEILNRKNRELSIFKETTNLFIKENISSQNSRNNA